MKTSKKSCRLLARLRQPKWRHGRRSILLMAAFLAVFVLVNAAVTGLENLYGWRKDLSYNKTRWSGCRTTWSCIFSTRTETRTSRSCRF